MLRIITSLIRNAPGPFKGARALTADFVEGLVDVIKPPAELEQPPPSPTSPASGGARHSPNTEAAKPAAAPSPSVDVQEPASSESEQAKTRGGDASESDQAADGQGWDRAYEAALAVSRWVRRQDFKVLAIFWKARQRALGPLTAKDAAALGDDLGVPIRHENIRKVIRTRLDDSIETSTVPDSQPSTYQYEMNDAGASFFIEEYLKKALPS